MEIGAIFVKLGVIDNFTRPIADAAGKFEAGAKRLQGIGVGLTAGVTAPIVGLGAAAFQAGNAVDDAMDAIRISTGATGQALAGLGADFTATLKAVPNAANDVAQAIGALNQRTGQTGEGLQELARQLLTVSRITESDLGANLNASTRLFGDWGIAISDQTGALDRVFRASQATGAGFTKLSEQLVQFGAPLREMGFNLDQSAALLGKFEKEGVNLELVLGGMKQGLAKFAEAGVAAPKALQDIIARIRELGPGAESTALAMQTFGARAGTDMVRAVLEGKFAIDELVASIASSPETIAGAAAATDGWKEKLAQLGNSVTVALAPLGDTLIGVVEDLTPAIEKMVGWIAKAAEGFNQLGPDGQTLALALLGIAAAIGPVVASFTAIITAVKGVGTALTLATNPWFLLGAAVVLTAALIVKHWDEIKAASAAVVQFFKDQFAPIGEAFDAVKDAAARLLSALAESWDALKEGVAALVDAVATAFSTGFAAAVDGVKDTIGRVTTFFGDVRENVGEHLSALFKRIDELFGGRLSEIASGVRSLLTRVIDGWRELGTRVAEFVTRMIDVVRDQLVGRLTGFVNAVKEKLGAITGFFRDMAEKVALKSYVPEMMSVIDAELGGRLSGIVAQVGQSTSAAASHFETMATAGGQSAGGLLDALKGKLVSGFQAEVVNPLQAKVDAIKGFFEGLAGQLERIVGFDAGGILGLLKKLLVTELEKIINSAIAFVQKFLDKFKDVGNILRGMQGGPTFPTLPGGGFGDPFRGPVTVQPLISTVSLAADQKEALHAIRGDVGKILAVLEKQVASMTAALPVLPKLPTTAVDAIERAGRALVDALNFTARQLLGVLRGNLISGLDSLADTIVGAIDDLNIVRRITLASVGRPIDFGLPTLNLGGIEATMTAALGAVARSATTAATALDELARAAARAVTAGAQSSAVTPVVVAGAGGTFNFTLAPQLAGTKAQTYANFYAAFQDVARVGPTPVRTLAGALPPPTVPPAT